MSAHDDEFPRSNQAAASEQKVPFSINNEILVKELRQLADAVEANEVFILVKELRQLADAVEANEVFPQEFVRTQRDVVDDFKMFTLSVTFGSPTTLSELQS